MVLSHLQATSASLQTVTANREESAGADMEVRYSMRRDIRIAVPEYTQIAHGLLLSVLLLIKEIMS